MKTSIDRTSVFSFAVAVALCATLFVGRYVAAEPKEACDEPSSARAVGSPILSKIPFINRIFKNAGNERLERIGIDFDIRCERCDASDACDAHQAACKKTCERAEKLCVRPFECCLESDHECCDFPGDPAQTAMFTYTAEREDLFDIVERIRREHTDREDELRDALLEATTAGVAAQAILMARVEFDAKETALRDALLESKLENATLAAKLQLVDEKEELLAALREAKSQNAMLQVQVELASHRSKLQEAAMTVQLERLVAAKVTEATQALEKSRAATLAENAELKAQIAALELNPIKRSRNSERTAKKPSSATSESR